MTEAQILTIGLPKGSLQESTIKLFRAAGYNIVVEGRSYFPYVNDKEIKIVLIRAQDMARYVELGIVDAGITGEDWIRERNADVERITELVYSKATRLPFRWVLAVPEDSPIRRAEDLEGKRIATELVEVTRRWLKSRKVNAEVEFSWGATEIKAPYLVDAIVEGTETGSSLRANNLRIVEEILTSTTQFIVNKNAFTDEWKRRKIENISMLLVGALQAQSKVGLKMNLRETDMQAILDLLPSLQSPTVSRLTESEWVAIEVIIDEVHVRELAPRLKRAGAEGIIEYSLNKLIY